MAVYTQVDDEALESFLTLYNIGGLLSYKGIAEGVENTNFLLHTEEGYYILTLYEKRVNESDLPFFLGLMTHLAGKGLECPIAVPQKSGETLGELAGRPAAIISFLDGHGISKPQPKHCFELGKEMAAFHLASQDFKIARPNALSVEGWRPLFEECEGRCDDIVMGLSVLIENELRELEDLWPRDLPSGVIHADLFPDNVFFIGEKLSGLIDFYFACNDAFVYDIAICLNAWCFERDNAFNITKARALLKGYETVRPLSEKERTALPLLARGSALRFLLTRSYDWLNTPEGALVRPKDPREYLQKLRFHQSVVSPSAYGLDS